MEVVNISMRKVFTLSAFVFMLCFGTSASGLVTETGRVMPFKILCAIRNPFFQNNMVAAQISITVEGGTPIDWMATGIYVAENSIINGVTFSEVEVYVPSPWGDQPPTLSKQLANVYYAPDPAHSPWKERWQITAADHAGTLADIEYQKLQNDLIEKYAGQYSDPDVLTKKVDAEAKKIVTHKYRLTPKWKPDMNLGLKGKLHDRAEINVVSLGKDQYPLSLMAKCLRNPPAANTCQQSR